MTDYAVSSNIGKVADSINALARAEEKKARALESIAASFAKLVAK